MELQVTNNFSDITSEILALAKMSEQAGSIAPELYTQYDVKRGLRDLNGKGVLAGLTNISDVRATKIVNGEAVPAHGQLFYRGYNVEDLVRGFSKDNRFGFDEVTYLLLFNKLPNKEELEDVYKRQSRSIFIPLQNTQHYDRLLLNLSGSIILSSCPVEPVIPVRFLHPLCPRIRTA